MSGFTATVLNQTNVSEIRVIGVSINPNVKFSIDALQNGQGSQSNLQSRGSRGLVIYNKASKDVIATGSVIIQDNVSKVTILVLSNGGQGIGLDFAFDFF